MNNVLDQIREQLATYGPNLLAGLAVLVVGWIVALLIAAIVRKALSKVSIDNTIARWLSGKGRDETIPVEKWAGTAAFYLVMLFVVIAFLQTVKLDVIVTPLKSVLEPVMGYMPHLIGGGLLALVAWVVATVLKKVVGGVLSATRLDDKLAVATADDGKAVPASSTFAELVYWLVFLLFLPAILQALQMDGLMVPVNSLLNKVCAFLPNLFSAVVIGVVGWFVARIAQRVVQGILASAGADRLSERWGLAPSLGKQKLSGVLGLVVYFLILVPVIVSALGALKLDAVTQPASDMLGKIMDAIPSIFGATVVVLIAVVVGKVVSGIVTNVLSGLGFNNILVALGLAKQPPATAKQSPAAWVGNLVMTLIVLLAAVTAADMLGFPSVGVLIQDFIRFAAHILMATAIFGLGLLLAQFAARAIRASDCANAPHMAMVVRIVVLALAAAMALRQTGLADEIVNLAFGLTLGAAAVAFALAFGLGGREMAARTLNRWTGGSTCCSGDTQPKG